mmetsp:Transcript_15634/g.48424  ORF Transcript_15634/g.48424 Transcript_15634/m.48424 type:complete len:302 (-) Transcript_15634:55-960(-)|eukprot:CAMPEP_0174855120 /NCGR_PEP_ID=MMETSP1114-20130205/32504_1 /TAXON_ID=312471 /ORGANISM="Neobodo designis, Strain CCAP 1951/1" /LENGTH=301 /DNA_ID=CAMNT_0016089845 /DNA_START=624 /DNA_END=1529 /DNA_ORIENTATION=-
MSRRLGQPERRVGDFEWGGDRAEVDGGKQRHLEAVELIGLHAHELGHLVVTDEAVEVRLRRDDDARQQEAVHRQRVERGTAASDGATQEAEAQGEAGASVLRARANEVREAVQRHVGDDAGVERCDVGPVAVVISMIVCCVVALASDVVDRLQTRGQVRPRWQLLRRQVLERFRREVVRRGVAVGMAGALLGLFAPSCGCGGGRRDHAQQPGSRAVGGHEQRRRVRGPDGLGRVGHHAGGGLDRHAEGAVGHVAGERHFAAGREDVDSLRVCCVGKKYAVSSKTRAAVVEKQNKRAQEGFG